MPTKRPREPLGESRGHNEEGSSVWDVERDKRGTSLGDERGDGTGLGRGVEYLRSLLARGGVDWSGEQNSDFSTGLCCRSSPARLRLFVEAAIEHDQTARQDFIQGLMEFLSKTHNLRRALLPLTLSHNLAGAGAVTGPGRRTRINTIEESLVKVLLRVDCVQPQVINMLLEKLPEIAAEEGEGMGDGTLCQDLPRLILNQMRFLDHLVDGTAMTQKLLECTTVLPLGLQREMISYLPEVVEDCDHASVVETLEELQELEPSLLVVVLDTLGNLSLPPDLLHRITTKALGQLESAGPSTLPVLVRFLLESATTDNSEAIVQEMRDKLRLSAGPRGMHSGAQGATGGGTGDAQEGGEEEEEEEETEIPWGEQCGSESLSSGDALTLEALRQGLRLRVDMASAFLKAILKSEGPQASKRGEQRG
ncbi:unnamed protein product [Discosporangium mesarthrocarpum]